MTYICNTVIPKSIVGFGHAKRDFQQQITKTYKIYKNTEYIPFNRKPKEIQNKNHQDQFQPGSYFAPPNP